MGSRNILFALFALLLLCVTNAAAIDVEFSANTTEGINTQTVQFYDETDYSSINNFDNSGLEAATPQATGSYVVFARNSTYSHTGNYSLSAISSIATGDAWLAIRPTASADRWVGNTYYYWECWVCSPTGGKVSTDNIFIMNMDDWKSFASGKINGVGGVHTLSAGTWTKMCGYGLSPSSMSTSSNSWLVIRPEYEGPNDFSDTAYLYYDDFISVPITFAWDFGDGNTSSSYMPTNTYYLGTYDVSLTVTHTSGTDIELKTNYIQISSVASTNYILAYPDASLAFISNESEPVVWVVDGVVQAETSDTLAKSFVQPGNHYVSANGVDNWTVTVKRSLATGSIEEFNESDYTTLISDLEGRDWEAVAADTVKPEVNLIGNSFYLILFLLPFALLWKRQETLLIPAILALIIGAVIIGFIPENYYAFIALAVILAGVAVLYGMSRDRG